MATKQLKVGVVGLGQMGRGIAGNLEANGLLAAVFDLNSAACVHVSAPVLSAQSMADQMDVVLFAVPSTVEIAEYLAGCTGSDTTIIDLTTSSPEQSTALVEDLETRGFSYIDAAMTGGAVGADAGTLTLMCGGEAENITGCAPVFDVISSQIFHLGPIGSGHAMKLVHNLILHSSFMATCEGLRLAERAGLDVNAAVDVLNAGNARSFVTEVRFPRDILSGTMNARSTVANLAKDLRLGVELADSLTGPAPIGALTLALLDAARDNGHAGTDFSHLFAMYDELAQLQEAET